MTESGVGAERPDSRHYRRRGFLFVAMALLCFSLDISSKYAVGHWLEFGKTDAEIIPNWFNIIYRVNEGGLFSFGREFGARMNSVLAVLSTVAIGVIVAVAYISAKRGTMFLAVVLGAILGGAAGNLYDRIVFSGVRDFLDFHYFEVYHYATFNIADSFLVVGATCLIVRSYFIPVDAAVPSESTT